MKDDIAHIHITVNEKFIAPISALLIPKVYMDTSRSVAYVVILTHYHRPDAWHILNLRDRKML